MASASTYATRSHLFGSIALLFSAAAARAQAPMVDAREPLAAASRDAQRLADCIKSLDAACAAPLYDAKSYELLNRLQNGRFSAELNAKDLARHFDTLRQKGVRFTHFETSPPQELFADGVRVYAFVPYGRAIEFPDDKRMSGTRSFLIALSADQGKTWTFVDAEGFTAERFATSFRATRINLYPTPSGWTAQWIDRGR